MINPLWLNTFKTLIDVGHFTQTAEKLYMTQPGVSQQIKKLEDACGHSLIKRVKKHFEITEQGRIMYRYAVKIAEDEAILLESLGFDDPFSGKCKLACSGSLALLLYPHLLSLQKQHSDLNIHLEAAPNQKILTDVLSGSIDLGIVTQIPNSSLYQSTAIGSEALCLVLPKAYKGKSITAELLSECGLIEHPDAAHYLSLYFDLCGDQGLADINIEALPKTGYINQLHQILLPVEQGHGFTVLPKSAVENFPGRSELYVAEGLQQVEETLYLVQKHNRDLPQRYQTVRQLLQEVLHVN